jgi:glycosyltransferase involved in cell wall biosynthesis
MKLSIVIPVLDSHEIVRRQSRYWNTIFQKDCEIILVDDGSSPPIQILWAANIPIKIFQTYDPSPWSEHMATNLGIEKAQGEYILKTDIDHIISKEVFDIGMRFDNPSVQMFFKRKEGKLDEHGNLIDLGVERKVHANSFIVKREWLIKAGGYNEYGEGYGTGGSYDLWKRLKQFGVVECVSNKYMYVWPNSPITPMEDQHLFHNLRKTL